MFSVLRKYSRPLLLHAGDKHIPDVRAGDTHGHTNVRRLQRGRVVHTVAGHRHDVARGLESLHDLSAVAEGEKEGGQRVQTRAMTWQKKRSKKGKRPRNTPNNVCCAETWK